MSQVYVNGPAELHVGTGTAGALEFLGWSESGVRVTIDGAFEDVMSDKSGSRIPFDVQMMGQQAFVSGDINLYNEGIYRKIAGRYFLGGGNPDGTSFAEGALGAYELGALMRKEKDAGASGMFRLLVVGPYGRGVGNKPAFSTMDQAYNFPNAYLADAVDLELSTRYKRIRTTFRAIPDWGQASYTGSLYNHDITGRAALN